MRPAPYDWYGGSRYPGPSPLGTDSQTYQIFSKDDNSAERAQLRGSFSFADIDARLILPFEARQGISTPTVLLPGLTFVSISSHQDSFPVVSLASRKTLGFTSSHILYSGSLGFITFGEHAFSEAVSRYTLWAKGEWGDFGYVAPQQLPPMDLSVTMISGDGRISVLYIKSLKLMSMSKGFGVDDVQIKETYSFIAASIRNNTLLFDEVPDYAQRKK